ncbi:MAG: hypothetical protein EA409_03355, partial [Saprospirales bacterium]
MQLKLNSMVRISTIVFVFFCISLPGKSQSFEVFASLHELNGPGFEAFAKLLINYENGECSIIEDFGDQQEKMISGIGFCSTGELYTLGMWNSPSAGILYIFDPDTGEFEYVTDAVFLHYQNGYPRLHPIACLNNTLYSKNFQSFWKFDMDSEEFTFLGHSTLIGTHSSDIGVLYQEVMFSPSNTPGTTQGIYQLDTVNPNNSTRIFPYPIPEWPEYWTHSLTGSPVCNSVFVTRQHPLFGDNKGAFYNVDNHSYSLICDMPPYLYSRKTSMAEHLPKEECEAIID